MTKTERRRIDEARELALRGSQGVYPGLERDLERAARLLEFAAPRRRTPAERAARKPQSVKVRDAVSAEREEGWRSFVAWVREQVWEMSASHCDHCARALLDVEGEMDHSRGGAYRREFTRIDWCRRLCRKCHKQRTDNKPSAIYWSRHMEDVRQDRRERLGDLLLGLIRDEEQSKLAPLARAARTEKESARNG